MFTWLLLWVGQGDRGNRSIAGRCFGIGWGGGGRGLERLDYITQGLSNAHVTRCCWRKLLSIGRWRKWLNWLCDCWWTISCLCKILIVVVLYWYRVVARGLLHLLDVKWNCLNVLLNLLRCSITGDVVSRYLHATSRWFVIFRCCFVGRAGCIFAVVFVPVLVLVAVIGWDAPDFPRFDLFSFRFFLLAFSSFLFTLASCLCCLIGWFFFVLVVLTFIVFVTNFLFWNTEMSTGKDLKLNFSVFITKNLSEAQYVKELKTPILPNIDKFNVDQGQI